MATRNGTSRSDVLRGTSGSDTINGLGGSDFLYGLSGRDVIKGGAGNDRIFGGEGNDDLRGETGNDRLTGGIGFDTLTGGDGSDRFIFKAGDSVAQRAGNAIISDVIVDFRGVFQGGTDKIDLTSVPNVIFQTFDVAGGKVLSYQAGPNGVVNEVFLSGIALINNADFIT